MEGCSADFERALTSAFLARPCVSRYSPVCCAEVLGVVSREWWLALNIAWEAVVASESMSGDALL